MLELFRYLFVYLVFNHYSTVSTLIVIAIASCVILLVATYKVTLGDCKGCIFLFANVVTFLVLFNEYIIMADTQWATGP